MLRCGVSNDFLYEFLVSKETVVLRRWELVLSNELIKVELPP